MTIEEWIVTAHIPQAEVDALLHFNFTKFSILTIDGVQYQTHLAQTPTTSTSIGFLTHYLRLFHPPQPRPKARDVVFWAQASQCGDRWVSPDPRRFVYQALTLFITKRFTWGHCYNFAVTPAGAEHDHKKESP